MVLDHRDDHPSHWAAVVSVSEKIGSTPPTLHDWLRKAEINSGKRAGIPDDVSQRMKDLEREVRELRQVNEILRKASTYFAPFSANASICLSSNEAELDRPFKRWNTGRITGLSRFAECCRLLYPPFIST